jgi:hypothetical protein
MHGMACGIGTPANPRQAATGKTQRSAVVLLLAVSSLAAEPSLPPPETLAEQRVQYDADDPKTIFELQPWRTASQVSLRRANGTSGVATLINLNPYADAWYVLTLRWEGTTETRSYHLESPQRRPLSLRAADPGIVHLVAQDGGSCDVDVKATRTILEDAAATGLPYAPLCGGWLYLRNPVSGRQSTLERVTDFLRDHVWGGERVISFVKEDLYRDAFLEQGVTSKVPGGVRIAPLPLAPLAASVAPESAATGIVPEHLGLDLVALSKELMPGQWYAVRDLPGVTVSVIAPQNIDPRIRFGHEASVNPLDAVESKALVYLVAFDLKEFDLHFALGTDHPRLDWSERPPPSSRDPELSGPDGIASAAPLVTNGMVSPTEVPHTVAAFAGGFKRSHGAFRLGPLAERNHGSHYGFIEEGVIFSKLQPGLATVFVTDAGATDLRTWSRKDDAQLAQLRYARQNGVPLIEYDPSSATGIPGADVNLWGPGNWSGSADEDLRTLRAGLCLQQNETRRSLIYAYFSAATPSAMARVFQAYHCRYALHLDMNALEHTYLALYIHRGQQRLIEHLINGMEVLDRSSGGQLAPRFLAFPDDRDFFYLTRREGSP